MTKLYDYDGLIRFASLTARQQEQIRDVLQTANFQAILTPTLMEVSYAGHDTGRHIVRLLCDVARIIVNADGEIVCSFSGDNTLGHNVSETEYEFYRIRDGKLYRQHGHIVRDESQEVCFET